MCAGALGQSLEQDLARCLAQNSWLTRVQCYDRAARSHGIEPLPKSPLPEPASGGANDLGEAETSSSAPDVETSTLSPMVAPGGDWSLAVEPGSAPGTENVWLMARSSAAIPAPQGDPIAAEIAVRCMDGTLDVMLWAGSGRFRTPQPILAMFDGESSQSLNWGVSTDGEWAFHPAPGAFIEAMARANMLYLTLQLVTGDELGFDFDLKKLPEMLPRLKSACPG